MRAALEIDCQMRKTIHGGPTMTYPAIDTGIRALACSSGLNFDLKRHGKGERFLRAKAEMRRRRYRGRA